MFPVRYELGFYIPQDGILPSDRREDLKSYMAYNKFAKKSGSYKCKPSIERFCVYQ
jgi:hypothetical protein